MTPKTPKTPDLEPASKDRRRRAEARSAKKSAYTRKAEAKLEETKAKLDQVKARAKGAVADGELELRSQFKKAQKQADTHMATVQRRLTRLKDSSEDSWEELMDGVETAWDDVSQSIKKIVKRF